jgi:cytochrome b561
MSTPRQPAAVAVSNAVDALAYPAFYSRTAVVLHWLIALLIACGFSLGVYMVDLHMSPTKLRLYSYHKWVGITVLALVLVRLVWRLTHRPPPEVPMPSWQLRTARATHYLLYALMIATPLFGWLYSSASGYSVVYLKLVRLPDLVHKDRHLAEILVQVHTFLAWSIFCIVLLHAAAAFKHHFIDHDDTLRRMLIWRRKEQTS